MSPGTGRWRRLEAMSFVTRERERKGSIFGVLQLAFVGMIAYKPPTPSSGMLISPRSAGVILARCALCVVRGEEDNVGNLVPEQLACKGHQASS
jgi:hypothetical protein